MRRYIFETWRRVLRGYGFVEVEGPMVEETELYRKKSGGEVVGQLWRFETQGGEDVALRPELTPTVARMLIARPTQYRKPIKWFSIGRFFRYEQPQKGRLREFYQLNADIIGLDGLAAEAELIAVVVDVLRAFGFKKEDFAVRLSNRDAWSRFLSDQGVAEAGIPPVLQVVDKLERDKPEVLSKRLAEIKPKLNLSLSDLQAFANDPSPEYFSGCFELIHRLAARGLDGFLKVDAAVVRGLAYYTGLVFEAFDRQGNNRALAGGGRYDQLISGLSDGKIDQPALGFGMGDVTLGDFIMETPAVREKMEHTLAADPAVQVFVVQADPDKETETMGLIQRLREAGWRVDCALAGGNVGKQFKQANALNARAAVVVGGEWPQITLKDLEAREERICDGEEILDQLEKMAGLTPGIANF